jgi:hypothetical protein
MACYCPQSAKIERKDTVTNTKMTQNLRMSTERNFDGGISCTNRCNNFAVMFRELCSGTPSTLDSVVMQPWPDYSDLISDKTNNIWLY